MQRQAPEGVGDGPPQLLPRSGHPFYSRCFICVLFERQCLPWANSFHCKRLLPRWVVEDGTDDKSRPSRAVNRSERTKWSNPCCYWNKKNSFHVNLISYYATDRIKTEERKRKNLFCHKFIIILFVLEMMKLVRRVLLFGQDNFIAFARGRLYKRGGIYLCDGGRRAQQHVCA